MIPRNLRHRLEKTARLLVTVQKHMPNVSCRFDDERGDFGQLFIDLPQGGDASQLGGDLESRGFQFTRAVNPWLGNIVYAGTKASQPLITITIATRVDRLHRTPESPQPHRFRS